MYVYDEGWRNKSARAIGHADEVFVWCSHVYMSRTFLLGGYLQRRREAADGFIRETRK